MRSMAVTPIFFPSDDQKEHFCYKLNEMTEVGESPKLKEDDKVKCKVNQCFRMKYWSKLFTKLWSNEINRRNS